MAKKRNNIIELGRFIYSLVVLGYHVQLSYDEDNKTVDPFECGALSVEYFFFYLDIFSTFSWETNFFKKYYYFMKNKITALLNVHIIAIVAVIIIIACCDTKIF